MARPRKKGLDYFPLDTDIFEDDKLFDVQNDYGPLGEVIYIRLLCLVYKNGYYYRFESLDKLAAMMMRSIGNRWAKDKKTVKDVILYLAKINLFSSELMQRNVITSRSIQERYLLAVERRQSKIVEYNLLENNISQEDTFSVPENQISASETHINAAKTQVNAVNNAPKERKPNESKENEMRGNENSFAASAPQPLRSYGEFQHITLTDSDLLSLEERFGKPNVEKYIRKMDVYLEHSGKTYPDCYLKLQKWLLDDNVKKELYDGYDPDKYKFLINNF
ncbi:MAG: DUF4373 domain-containing protein [Ruminococcus sp.]|nr:DUF4373 domain-containing protein [Ruminococcus sp.]